MNFFFICKNNNFFKLKIVYSVHQTLCCLVFSLQKSNLPFFAIDSEITVYGALYSRVVYRDRFFCCHFFGFSPSYVEIIASYVDIAPFVDTFNPFKNATKSALKWLLFCVSSDTNGFLPLYVFSGFQPTEKPKNV